jgi:hypothetical protein
MAEMPLVIVDVQRGGPSTGMPTNVEQSDLNIAVNGGHGDSPRVVIAPASVEDCFYMAIEAVNIARKYSVPVIILTDQGIATRIEAFTEPDLEKVCQDISPDLTPVADHKPYDLSAADGVTPHLAPGTKINSGKYPIVTGLEHDELGHPTGSPKLHMQMTAKRRRKLQALGRRCPCRKFTARRKATSCSSAGVRRKARSRKPWTARAPPATAFPPPHQAHQSAAERTREHFLRLQPHSRRRDERRGLYGYGQLAAILRARYCDPKIQRHQQDRRPHLEGEGNPRTRPNVVRRIAKNNLSFPSLKSYEPTLDRNSRPQRRQHRRRQPARPPNGERKGLTKKEIAADHPTWCPGCGDFSVLALYFKLIEKRKMWHEKITTVAGIGCSSRFPYFVQAHGAHFIHGRALPFASGISLSRPDLHVFVFGGDGDAFSIGGNHFNHTARKNIKMTYCVMDNWVYGLTKKQTSPTSPLGFKSKTDQWGAVDYPINPMKQAISAGATFVARTTHTIRTTFCR